ncbi:MAG TPA: hypothetical protein VF173_00775 [Thermoanaerobaculia bacterium]|nr:hypothetical protein [Thermoanaerobaculia bacterium]
MSREKYPENPNHEAGQDRKSKPRVELGKKVDEAMGRLLHSGAPQDLEAAERKMEGILADFKQSSSSIEKAAMDKVFVERIEGLISNVGPDLTVESPSAKPDGTYENWMTFHISRLRSARATSPPCS